VNMNQLAHMALQHQGLCPTEDKKYIQEDLGPQQSQAGGVYRPEQWEDVGPRGQRSNQHLDNTGIGMSCCPSYLHVVPVMRSLSCMASWCSFVFQSCPCPFSKCAKWISICGGQMLHVHSPDGSTLGGK